MINQTIFLNDGTKAILFVNIRKKKGGIVIEDKAGKEVAVYLKNENPLINEIMEERAKEKRLIYVKYNTTKNLVDKWKEIVLNKRV